MKRILSFKHWQLFLLIVITGAWTSPSPLKEIINSISFITFSIWIYAIGVYGHEKIEQMGLPTFNLKLFKANIILVPILILFVVIIAPTPTEEAETKFDLLTAVLIPIGLYLIFAVFQTVIFACKTLATIELKRQVVFSDYLTNLILVLFLFVGIWILQPKITRLIANENLPTID